MSKLYIPIGIPGSGKSTWCHEHLCALSVSTDEIRANFGDVNDQSRNDEVFELYHQAIESNLRDRYDVVADATNLTVRAREQLYEISSRSEVDVHIILFANVAQAFARNAKRERRVPDGVMLRMLDNFEKTCFALPGERSWYKSLTEIASLD